MTYVYNGKPRPKETAPTEAKPKAKRKGPEAACGTRAGLSRHSRNKEIACAACLKADADYQRARYAAKKQAAA